MQETVTKAARKSSTATTAGLLPPEAVAYPNVRELLTFFDQLTSRGVKPDKAAYTLASVYRCQITDGGSVTTAAQPVEVAP